MYYCLNGVFEVWCFYQVSDVCGIEVIRNVGVEGFVGLVIVDLGWNLNLGNFGIEVRYYDCFFNWVGFVNCIDVNNVWVVRFLL